MKKSKETSEVIVSTIAELEIKAKEKAKETIANQLQRPDQLDKLDQMKKKYSRKKASVESMLKTSIQSQLEGVKTGVTQLQMALRDIGEVRTNLREVSELYEGISGLSTRLQEVREENVHHSQYAAAMENLKLIFSAPETVRKCQDYLDEGKLLHAHKCLADLEMSRDDLLFELSKQPSRNPADEHSVNAYYAEVAGLGEKLGKQVWMVMKRMTNTARRDPTAVVTALRIVEREEKSDAAHLKRYQDIGFLPPGRLRHWRQKVFSCLEKSIEERVEASQIEGREGDKMWLVRHLEVIRQIVLEDLQVIKTICEPLFPPHYEIMKQYTSMYHRMISKHLSGLITDQMLEGNETVTLLTWTQEYRSRDMLGHPDLHIDLDQLGPLLDESQLRSVQDQYLKSLRDNLKEWMKNSLRTDSRDWYRDVKPDTDSAGYFMTSLPLLLFQMIEQNLQVAKLISEQMAQKLLAISGDELEVYQLLYREHLIALKNKHLVDRREPPCYIHYLIGNINNCETISAMMKQIGDKYRKVPNADEERRYGSIRDGFIKLGVETCDWLLEEVFMDVDQYVQELLTKKWLTSNVPVDTICATLEDYAQDFVHLKKVFYKATLDKAERKVTAEYLKALFAKKMSLKSYDDRVQAATKISRDANQIKILFSKLLDSKEGGERGLDAIPPLSEMIRLQDPTMLSLEISGYVHSYPDVRIEQLVNLILLRGDVQKGEAKQIVVSCLGEDHDGKPKAKRTILSSELL